MSTGSRRNGGKGSGPGHDDFDALIRDRDDEFSGGGWDNPRAGYDPYEDFAASGGSAHSRGYGDGGFADRGLVEAITRIIDTLAGAAGDALAPETRRQMEKVLRDLLVVLRDVIDAIIERIDNRREDDFEIEEIPID